MPGPAVFFALLTGLGCFVLGAVCQQHITVQYIKSTMLSDAYLYNSRRKIFKACVLLGDRRRAVKFDENAGEGADMDSVLSNILGWAHLKLVKVGTLFVGPDRPTDMPFDKTKSISDIMKYGFPGTDDIRVYQSFVLSYDRRNRIAHWVCEHLRGELIGNAMRSPVAKTPALLIDRSTPLLFRSTDQDYKRNDWTGGHFAAPLNHGHSPSAYSDTFLLSNMVPQNESLKNTVWLRLENYVRDLALKSGSVYVYTGPLFMPQRLNFRNWAIRYHVVGVNTVAVPTHFFKIIISENKNSDSLPLMEGYVLPNAAISPESELHSFLTNIHDIEHFAGLKFFEGMRRYVGRNSRNT